MSLLSKAYYFSVFAKLIGTVNFNVRVALEKLAIERCLQYRLGNTFSRVPLRNQLEGGSPLNGFCENSQKTSRQLMHSRIQNRQNIVKRLTKS